MAMHRGASELAALGREWVAAWNSRDLERAGSPKQSIFQPGERWIASSLRSSQ